MDTQFDDWLRESPARHTAIFALLVIATVALLTGV